MKTQVPQRSGGGGLAVYFKHALGLGSTWCCEGCSQADSWESISQMLGCQIGKELIGISKKTKKSPMLFKVLKGNSRETLILVTEEKLIKCHSLEVPLKSTGGSCMSEGPEPTFRPQGHEQGNQLDYDMILTLFMFSLSFKHEPSTLAGDPLALSSY